MNLPLIKLSGTAYNQGLAHGAALRSQIQHNLAVYFNRFLHEAGVQRDEVLQRAARYAGAIARSNPDYDDGMRGIAAGADCDLLEITALNVRYEILYHELAQKQMERARDGCTAFALLPQNSANGHLLLGQNWDWIPDVKGAILHTTLASGHQTLAFTEAGIFGGKIGLNSAGLGLAINGLTTTTDDWERLTKPFHLRCYEILLQNSLASARAVIEEEARACAANFLIAATPDSVANVEAAPESANVLAPQNGCLVHANHFVDAAAIGVVEPPSETRPTSCQRQERLTAFLQSAPAVRIEQIQGWLQDHHNEPRSICRHERLDAPVDEQYRTVTSIVMDLHEQKLWATDGPPCQNDYKLYSLQTGSA